MNKSEKRFQIFAREYVKDLNGKRAAIAAGYKENAAASQASALLTKPHIQKLVEKYQKKAFEAAEMSAQDVLLLLKHHASGNILDFGHVAKHVIVNG